MNSMGKQQAKTENSKQGATLINGILVQPDEGYSVDQAAKIMQRSAITIYRMIKGKELKPVFQRRTTGGRGKLTIWGIAIINASRITK